MRPYPRRSDYWEISHFGVLREHKTLGLGLYAIMFSFADMVNARALVAVTDLGHERLLSKIRSPHPALRPAHIASTGPDGTAAASRRGRYPDR